MHHALEASHPIVAIAGRRIDAADAEESRFPERCAAAVKADLTKVLSEQGCTVLVASAACGADILALEAALELGLRIRIVLPFERERFRETSAVDRGIKWGPRFDRVLDAAGAQGDLIVLEAGSGDDDAAYGRATARIIEEAATLARGAEVRAAAIAIWDEKPRAAGDATQEFLKRAKAAGMDVTSILTLRDV